MNPLENTIELNIKLALLDIKDIPKYDYNFCSRKSYYDWLNREIIGEEHFKFIKTQYDEARNYLKNCGKPKDEYDRFMIDHYKEISKRYSIQLTGETLYLIEVKRDFEKTDKYKLIVLQNYIKKMSEL